MGWFHRKKSRVEKDVLIKQKELLEKELLGEDASKESDPFTNLVGIEDVYLDEVVFWLRISEKLEPTFAIMSDSEIKALARYLEGLASNITVEITYPNIKITKKEQMKTPEGEAYVALHKEAFELLMDSMSTILQSKRLAYLGNLGKEEGV